MVAAGTLPAHYFSASTLWLYKEYFPGHLQSQKCNYHLSIYFLPLSPSFKLKLDKIAPILLNCRGDALRLCCVLVTDLTWRDLDLVLERAPVPPYPRSPLDVVLPVMYGILLGFGGTLLAGLFLLLVINRSSERQQSIATTRHHQVWWRETGRWRFLDVKVSYFLHDLP